MTISNFENEDWCPKCGSLAGYNHECTICTGEEKLEEFDASSADKEKESHDINN